ncbi:MAG: hypothetical protein GX113_01775 [Actinobacteria bacterium]|jgi:hypothetical protein|nr:hypothetical protein [Actinomycetota bacterium]
MPADVRDIRGSEDEIVSEPPGYLLLGPAGDEWLLESGVGAGPGRDYPEGDPPQDAD